MDPKNSPLGNKSLAYLTAKPESASILLKSREQTLEFYPAGYTKPSSFMRVSRQVNYMLAYELAVSNNREDKLYPISSSDYELEIRHVENSHDKYACLIVYKPNESSHLASWDLGYVPKRISKEICQNLNLINKGYILKVKANFNKRLYGCKVIFGYGNTFKAEDNSDLYSRFVDILEDS